MTERMHDMPHVATRDDTETPPSAEWFSRQGDNFLEAKDLIRRIGVRPDEIRAYQQSLPDDSHERTPCDMALDAAKIAASNIRLQRYGTESDLYAHGVEKAALTLLGKRAMASFERSRSDLHI